MAKCNCSGSTCGCKVQGLGSVSVSGTGTAQDPYVVTLNGLNISSAIQFDDSATIDFTVLGSGTNLDPYVVSADVITGTTQTSVPTTGGTTTLGTAENAHLLNHSGTIATHTVVLPASSTSLLKEITIIANAAITALTVSGDTGTTVQGAPTTLAANGFMRFRLIGTVWRRVG